MLVYQRALLSELAFLDSIVTSPLHRQTKSPTLWYHRGWLLQLLGPLEAKNASGKRIATFITVAINSVCKSGERHPTNYYAWQYARRLVLAVAEVAGGDDAPFPFDWVVSAFTERVYKWCFQHPSDISGWSFLLFLLMRLDPISERDDVVDKVLKYASQMKSENESLWVFVRLALTHPTLLADREAFVETLKESIENVEPGSPYSEYLKQSLHYIGTSGKTKTLP